MVRIFLIDEPAEDAALNGVLKKITGNLGGHLSVSRRVRMLHDGLGRINGDPVFDLCSGLELAAREYPREPLTGVDFVGHGAPGVLLLGGSVAGGPRTKGQAVREWAQLDSDVNKLPALVPFARRLRELKKQGRLSEDFEVRVLGCNTASDPGVTPSASMGILQDGPVLIHLLSSFFDAPVSGVIGYIGPENFADGSFQQGEIQVRSCAASTITGSISFTPDQFPPGASLIPRGGFHIDRLFEWRGGPAQLEPALGLGVGSGGGRKLTQPVDRVVVNRLFGLFEPVALPLPTSLPLVIRDASVHFGAVTVDIVEHGKALLVRDGDRTYRAAPKLETRDLAQEGVAFFLEQQTARRPLWADPAAARALYF